jgi:hydroxymethylbilane synthase
LETLSAGARVGTSSLRRQALLRRWRPDFEPCDLRGNVPTRLRRLDEGRFDAIVLAAAGLHRLSLTDRIAMVLPPDRFPPAIGQGALAVQVRSADCEVRRLVERLDDSATRAATTAERALLARLEGGCQIPLGALGEVRDGQLTLRATVCSLDGGTAIEAAHQGDAADPVAVGEALAETLLRGGAGELLATLRGRLAR